MFKFLKKIKIKNLIKKYGIENVERQWKILNIMRIVQSSNSGLEYSGGRFYFAGGFMAPDYRTEEEKQRDWERATKDWSEYRKKHGYEEGSYMDKINKAYGGLKKITVMKNFVTPVAKVYNF